MQALSPRQLVSGLQTECAVQSDQDQLVSVVVRLGTPQPPQACGDHVGSVVVQFEVLRLQVSNLPGKRMSARPALPRSMPAQVTPQDENQPTCPQHVLRCESLIDCAKRNRQKTPKERQLQELGWNILGRARYPKPFRSKSANAEAKGTVGKRGLDHKIERL